MRAIKIFFKVCTFFAFLTGAFYFVYRFLKKQNKNIDFHEEEVKATYHKMADKASDAFNSVKTSLHR